MRTNWQLAFGLSSCWPAGCWLIIYTRLLKHPVFHSISFIHSSGWLYPSSRQSLTDAGGVLQLLPASISQYVITYHSMSDFSSYLKMLQKEWWVLFPVTLLYSFWEHLDHAVYMNRTVFFLHLLL